MSDTGPALAAEPCRGSGVPMGGPSPASRLHQRVLDRLDGGRLGEVVKPLVRAAEVRARAHRAFRRPTDFAFLLSYPRSGNHWLRYVVEVVSGRSTLGAADGFHLKDTVLNADDTPIAWRLGGVVDGRRPILVKRHVLRRHDDRSRPVVLLVRDPVEAVASHAEYRWSPEAIERALGLFRVMALQLPTLTGPRCVIRFASVTHPDPDVVGPELRRLLTFLGLQSFEPPLRTFLSDLPAHRAASEAALRRPPMSRTPAATSDEAAMVRAYVEAELGTFFARHPEVSGPFIR